MRTLHILPLAAVLIAGCTTGPHRQALVRTSADLAVPEKADVVITEAAAVTVTLPPAAAAPRGRVITVRAFGGTAHIVATSGDQIDAEANLDLDKGEMASLISDGATRWIIISSSDL